jgi:hypothetical protein
MMRMNEAKLWLKIREIDEELSRLNTEFQVAQWLFPEVEFLLRARKQTLLDARFVYEKLLFYNEFIPENSVDQSETPENKDSNQGLM